MIDSFSGDFRFLSNFFPVEVAYFGLVFPTTEHAYQAAKTLDLFERAKIAAIPVNQPGKAKRAGQKITLRPDWEDVKIQVMRDLTTQKFATGSLLAEALLLTGDETLVEGNTWNDTFWGICNGKGRNELGKLLMARRNELRLWGM